MTHHTLTLSRPLTNSIESLVRRLATRVAAFATRAIEPPLRPPDPTNAEAWLQLGSLNGQ